MKADISLENRLARGAVIAIWLLIAHCLWDYPLRTISMAAVFGVCAGLLTAPVRVNAQTVADSWARVTEPRRRRRKAGRKSRA